MSRSPIVVPGDDELLDSTGLEVVGRETIRKTSLSVVQRLQVKGGEQQFVVLKTTVPEMRHEAAVHEFVSGTDISATRLLASNIDTPFPWLIQEDLGTMSEITTPGVDKIGGTLEALAEFHVRSITDQKSGKSPVVAPIRSESWLLANLKKVLAVINQALQETDSGYGPSLSDADFAHGLERLAKITARIPVALVHGDFDPGNVVQVGDRWRAIDWGLSHWNIPFVDVSHMLSHYPTSEHFSLTQRYLDAANRYGLDLQSGFEIRELDQHGKWAHDAFFLWWHSLCITELGMPAEQFAPKLFSRYQAICDMSPDGQGLLSHKFGGSPDEQVSTGDPAS